MSETSRTPDEFAQGSPADLDKATGQTRIVMAEVQIVQGRLSDLADQHRRFSDKIDKVPELASSVGFIKEAVSELRTNSRSDHRFVLAVFGAGFVLLGSMTIASYLLLVNKVDSQAIAGQRIETKLDDLIARLPPTPTPIPARPASGAR